MDKQRRKLLMAAVSVSDVLTPDACTTAYLAIHLFPSFFFGQGLIVS